jgi:hypothetical protein
MSAMAHHLLLAPLLLSFGAGASTATIVTRGIRPLAKGAILGGLIASRGVQRTVAEARASFEDLYDEARDAAVRERPTKSDS